jgi:hypothetical protein
MDMQCGKGEKWKPVCEKLSWTSSALRQKRSFHNHALRESRILSTPTLFGTGNLPRTLRFNGSRPMLKVGYSDKTTHGLNVLKRVQDRFIDTSIGEGAKETTNAILHWLHELIQYILP